MSYLKNIQLETHDGTLIIRCP